MSDSATLRTLFIAVPVREGGPLAVEGFAENNWAKAVDDLAAAEKGGPLAVEGFIFYCVDIL
ncbi:MAG: hypothetical protein LUF82_00400 [Clostridia bacterium]|nr:hypothetical protein [Clostridia bacterium]